MAGRTVERLAVGDAGDGLHDVRREVPPSRPRQHDAWRALHGRQVDVQHGASRRQAVHDRLHQQGRLGGEPERDLQAAVVEPEAAVAGLLRDRDGGHVEDGGLERRADRARVGEVVADVQAVIDARDDEVDRRHQPREEPDAHAVDRRPRACEQRVAVGAAGSDDADGPVERDGARDAAAIAVGGDHRHAQPEFEQPVAERRQPFGARRRRRWSGAGVPCGRDSFPRRGAARKWSATGEVDQTESPCSPSSLRPCWSYATPATPVTQPSREA